MDELDLLNAELIPIARELNRIHDYQEAYLEVKGTEWEEVFYKHRLLEAKAMKKHNITSEHLIKYKNDNGRNNLIFFGIENDHYVFGDKSELNPLNKHYVSRNGYPQFDELLTKYNALDQKRQDFFVEERRLRQLSRIEKNKIPDEEFNDFREKYRSAGFYNDEIDAIIKGMDKNHYDGRQRFLDEDTLLAWILNEKKINGNLKVYDVKLGPKQDTYPPQNSYIIRYQCPNGDIMGASSDYSLSYRLRYN